MILRIKSLDSNTKIRNTRLYILGCKIGCLFCKTLISNVYCGERGIRTPGPVKVNSFQDCRNRPLCHLSIIVELDSRNAGFLEGVQR